MNTWRLISHLCGTVRLMSAVILGSSFSLKQGLSTKHMHLNYGVSSHLTFLELSSALEFGILLNYLLASSIEMFTFYLSLLHSFIS